MKAYLDPMRAFISVDDNIWAVVHLVYRRRIPGIGVFHICACHPCELLPSWRGLLLLLCWLCRFGGIG